MIDDKATCQAEPSSGTSFREREREIAERQRSVYLHTAYSLPLSFFFLLLRFGSPFTSRKEEKEEERHTRHVDIEYTGSNHNGSTMSEIVGHRVIVTT